jgi:AraC-like DNA-binding protein
MEDNISVLEITSGICCILTAIFLHYSAIPKNNNKKNYQKGYILVEIASLILGVSALTFALMGGYLNIYGKSYFIQLILPVETLLVFWIFVYPLYEREKLKNFLRHQVFYTSLLCTANVIYIFMAEGKPGEWFYYILLSCYIIQFIFYTIIYLHIAKIWLRGKSIEAANLKKYPLRTWAAAFTIGVMGIIAEIYPNYIYLQIFTLCYTVFFISLGIQYHNYSVIAPSEPSASKESSSPTISEPHHPEEKRHSQNNDVIKEKIALWKESKGYLKLGITIQDLSREIGVNRTYLSNYINETYQTNFNGWVNDLRIEEAKQKIIQSPDINLSDLAEMAGFADQAHFSKQFKLKEGIPPSVWKKDHRPPKEKS